MTHSKQHGFTLIELMVVIAIVAVLTSVGLPAFQELIASQRLKAVTSTLQSALMLTRSEALKRNDSITMAPKVSGHWNQAWDIKSSDGTLLSTYDAAPTLTIIGPTSVVFQGSGRVVSSTGAYFKVTSTSTTAIGCITIALSGTASISSSGC